MKIAELVSALEELGTIYRHASKNEPKPCIKQVLEMLEGKEHLQVADLRVPAPAKPAKKAAAPKTPKVTKAAKFDQDYYLKRFYDAATEPAFEAALDELKKAKPTNDNLTNLLAAYTGIPIKKGRKKDDLINALQKTFKAGLRHDNRAEISRNTLPI